MARAGQVAGGSRKQIPFTLSQVEFVRRWSLHVLPSGYTRTRRFGGWANTNREQYLELFARLLDAADAPLSDRATEFEFGPLEDSSVDQAGCSSERLCKVCGCLLIPHSMTPKPSWASVMNSKHRPSWYPRH